MRKGSEEGRQFATAYGQQMPRTGSGKPHYEDFLNDTAEAYDKLSTAQKRDAWDRLGRA